MGKFIPTSTLMGGNLYKGNHLETQGAYFVSTDSLLTPEIKSQMEGSTEVQRDSILQSEAVKLILSNKREVALLTLKKVPRLWLNLGYGRTPSKKSLVLAAFHLALIGFGIYGLTQIPASIRYLTLVPLTTIVLSSLMYLAVASEVRFVLPLVPLLLPYSARGFLAAVGRSNGDAQ
jgi:hypothetical protein